MSIAVMTDSGSGISPQEAIKMGVEVVPMPFSMDGELYREDINITRDEFFKKLTPQTNITTSQPSPETLMAAWDRALETHDEVLYIPLTSGLSSTFQTAQMLASSEEKYQGRVVVCDARGVSAVQSMICDDAVRLAREGHSAKEISSILEKNAGRNDIYIFLDTLEYLKHGGRATRAVLSIANILKIKPILKIENGSRLDVFSRGRTTKNCREKMIAQLRQDLKNRFHDPEAQHCHLGVAYTDSLDEAHNFAKEIAKAFPNRRIKDIIVRPLSLIICCHTGPGGVGCGFYCPIEEE